MEANKCRKCAELIEAGEIFCSEECERAFYNTANAAELRALDAENGIKPVRNFAEEAGLRVDAGEAKRELARELARVDLEKQLDKMVDEAIEARKLERIDRKDEAARLMTEGSEIETCDLCGQLKNL